MRAYTMLLAAACASGCGREPQNMNKAAPEQMQAFDVAEPPASEPAPAPAGPQIAYTYAVTYGFDRRNVGEVQGRQLALCRELGPARCVVVKSTLSAAGPDDHIVTDQAILLVDARLVGRVNDRLDALAAAGGAELSNRQVEAEDVTRQVIDTDARVRAKQALADRLLAIIRTRGGKVGELVEAERAYATTQEELDAARGQRAELARRVAMSRVSITYSLNDTPGGASPVGAALGAAGGTLATSLAALVTAAVAALPWLLVGWAMVAGLRRLRRRMGWRWPRRI